MFKLYISWNAFLIRNIWVLKTINIIYYFTTKTSLVSLSCKCEAKDFFSNLSAVILRLREPINIWEVFVFWSLCLTSIWAYLASNFCPFVGVLCGLCACALPLFLHFSHFYNEFWFYAKSTQLEFIPCSFLPLPLPFAFIHYACFAFVHRHAILFIK